jgi:hypothetical protein
VGAGFALLNLLAGLRPLPPVREQGVKLVFCLSAWRFRGNDGLVRLGDGLLYLYGFVFPIIWELLL